MIDGQVPRRVLRYGESYLTADPELAQMIGLDAAIVLSRISFLLHVSRGKRGHVDERGTVWIWNSYAEWRNDHFPFFTLSHMAEVIRGLEHTGLLVSRQRASHDRRKLYTIDYEAVDRLVEKAASPKTEASRASETRGKAKEQNSRHEEDGQPSTERIQTLQSPKGSRCNRERVLQTIPHTTSSKASGLMGFEMSGRLTHG